MRIGEYTGLPVGHEEQSDGTIYNYYETKDCRTGKYIRVREILYRTKNGPCRYPNYNNWYSGE
jgi:hypothetical protein